MLGVDRPGSHLKFKSTEVLVSGKTIMGSIFGGLKPKSDIPILVKRYLDKVTLSCSCSCGSMLAIESRVYTQCFYIDAGIGTG